MSDTRHWILNPAGHRQHLAIGRPNVGDTIAGIEVIAVLDDMLDDDEWICDRCNRPILTRWGDEPFPVAADGSDALCATCQAAVEATEGRWPPQSCTCPPCTQTMIAWADFIDHAYGIRRNARLYN